MIKMTQRAAQKVKADLANLSLPETTVIRIEAEQVEGKEKLQLKLRLDSEEPGQDDEVESTEGARLAASKELARLLGNAQLDFSEETGGFLFERAEASP